MYHLRVTLALCLTGLLAASPAHERDYREQTNPVLEGDQRNVSDILKQSLSRHRRAYSREHFEFDIMMHSMHRFGRPKVKPELACIFVTLYSVFIKSILASVLVLQLIVYAINQS